ncbi:MAG: hypothetical protein D6710_06510 [Nitrospirae bacterium]|nr:MAG: hypothetical protein D6710_06510 [Nitrospirota bacterium]
MRRIAQDIEPDRFFQYYLVKVCSDTDVNHSERFLQIEYLSKMLSNFIDPERSMNEPADLVRIIDVLKEQVERVEVSLDAYQHAADKILFYQSFYPEAFKRRLLDLKFYSKAARAFYRIVGNYRTPVCGLISREYSLWSFVLRAAREKYWF